MFSAKRVLLSGSSAGGQAVVTWCDDVAAMVPTAQTKCIMDSGFFLDTTDRTGAMAFRARVQSMGALHKYAGNAKCLQAESRATRWRCFFPEYALAHVATPLLILNPLLDHRALMLGNQLPFSTTGRYVAQCLSDIMRSTRNVTRAMLFKGQRQQVAGKVTLCSKAEALAVLNVANLLFRKVQALVAGNKKWVGVLPAAAVHCYIFKEQYVKAAVGGQPIATIVANWLAGTKLNSSFVCS
eukprot:TRINITY_DN28946_c0_g3_i1.p1 TRINITY_DN28946_c0_g3~~TRINITY_DN28946_c0_g3_i1.p1  ORF type:complete len:240 (-),score=9.41 TRINITY_DN28946_c0_g3_i1:60-779(-)